MTSLQESVKAFSIAGRVSDQRQRCLGMTDVERQWRAQFLKDQILSRDEPRNVPELYKDTTHFLRRLWRTPMWNLQKTASSLFGETAGYYIRHMVGKGTGLFIMIYLGTYYVKYHANDWTNKKAAEFFEVSRRMFPFEPGYPNYEKKTDFYDLGFKSSPYARKIEKPPPPEDSPPRILDETLCPKE